MNEQRIKLLQARLKASAAKRKAIESDIERLRRLPAGSIFTVKQMKKEWWAEQAKATAEK